VAAQKAAGRQDAARKATAQKRSAVRNLVSRAAEPDNPPAAPPPTKSTAKSTAKGRAKSTAKGTAKVAKVRQGSDKSRQLAPQKTARKKPPPAKAVPEESSAQDGPNR
jgi:hypothetical protein